MPRASRTITIAFDEVTCEKWIEHQSNRGHIAAYNDGLAAATGDYVVLLSADDALPDGALARALVLMSADPTVGLVYDPAATLEDHPPSRDELRSSDPTRWTIHTGGVWLERVAERPGTPSRIPRSSSVARPGRPPGRRIPDCPTMRIWRSGSSSPSLATSGGSTALCRAGTRSTARAGTSNPGRFREEHAPSSPEMERNRQRGRHEIEHYACRLARGFGWWDTEPPPVEELRQFARAT